MLKALTMSIDNTTELGLISKVIQILCTIASQSPLTTPQIVGGGGTSALKMHHEIGNKRSCSPTI
jgi:hypothetical protein